MFFYCLNCILAIGDCVLKHMLLEACLFLLRTWQQNGSLSNQARRLTQILQQGEW